MTASPAALRAGFRAGRVALTGAMAKGFTQANIAIVPLDSADAFEAFLRANPAACPLLARGTPGDPGLPDLGQGIDIRHDLPRYRVFRDGVPGEMPGAVAGMWREDLVTFAIGCSLSFESDLVASGVHLRCHGPGVSCSAFDTTVANHPVGPFGGNLVVSMRAIRADQVALAAAITQAHPDAHGAPVSIGAPAAIGVDLTRPIDGIGLTDVQPGEVPVFWACGVTLERAIQSARLPFAITHAPGHMLITDRRAQRLAEVSHDHH